MYEKIQNILRKISESTKATMIMYGIGTLLVAVIIFQAGIIVGSRKDTLIHEQYKRYSDITKQLPTVHGTTGTIISINLPTILVADEDATEKIITVRDETIIRSVRNNLVATDLKPGDFIVVIGTPNTQGYIQANFIRILPNN